MDFDPSTEMNQRPFSSRCQFFAGTRSCFIFSTVFPWSYTKRMNRTDGAGSGVRFRRRRSSRARDRRRAAIRPSS